MPIKKSPPARQKRYQIRSQVVLTPTPRAPLDSTPAVPQLRTQFGRSSTIQEDQEANSVEEEEYDGTEGVPAPVGASQGTGGPALAQSNQPVSHHSEPSLLAIMQKMTQIRANLQAASSSEASRPPAFKTSSMKAPELFDGTQPFKVRSFVQSCQLIFHNYMASFSQDRKKVLYATSFLIVRAEKWIGLYLSNLTNQDPSYLLILGFYLNLNSLRDLGPK
ncbi:hypothetical protein O181_006133 [Austropuccinia psidii MF-1]|uniref:DUF4939 domain-containing protein n=1 Tax=Austropuccinia psidii MF-1 TaxID=1389203 RepID=A0A9Q3GG93_9BASI|nr:hypothetical protein [Austropuccinia psidii MF-1]